MRASMAAGDDHSLPRFFLDVVKQVDQDWINPFASRDDRQSMPSLAVLDRIASLRSKDGRIGGVPFAAEVFLSNPRKMGLCFPRIERTRRMSRSCKRIETIILAPINHFSFAIAAANLLFFRLFEARTCKREADYS